MESGTQAARLGAAGAASGDEAIPHAVEQAARGLDRPASVIFAFPTGTGPDVTADLGALSASVNAPVVGMTGNGSIAGDGALEQGCAALALDDSVSAGLGVAADVEDLRDAASQAATEALGSAGNDAHRLLLLFLDTRTGDQADAVAGRLRGCGPWRSRSRAAPAGAPSRDSSPEIASSSALSSPWRFPRGSRLRSGTRTGAGRLGPRQS